MHGLPRFSWKAAVVGSTLTAFLLVPALAPVATPAAYADDPGFPVPPTLTATPTATFTPTATPTATPEGMGGHSDDDDL